MQRNSRSDYEAYVVCFFWNVFSLIFFLFTSFLYVTFFSCFLCFLFLFKKYAKCKSHNSHIRMRIASFA